MDILTWIRGATATALLICSTAWSQSEARGFELERMEFNLAKGSILFGNGELLSPNSVSIGLIGHYQYLPLALPLEEQLAGVQHRASAVLAGSYGVLPWFEVGAQLPVVLWQKSGEISINQLPPLTSQGLGTPVLHARLGLLSRRKEQPVDLAVDLAAGLPLGNAAALARDPGMRFHTRVTVGRQWGWIHPALEAGVLLRPPNPLLSKASRQLVPELSLGAALATSGEGLRGELTIQGALAREDRRPSIQVLGGVRSPLTPTLELFALGGPGLGNALGTPTGRVLLGMNFRMEPPPSREQLAETMPQFTLEAEATSSHWEAPRPDVAPIPTREPVPAEVPSVNTAPLLQGAVLFKPGRAKLSGNLSLLQAVLWLRRSQPGKTVILLEGHANQEELKTAGRLLPLKRARAVRHYLAKRGVPLKSVRVRTASLDSSEFSTTPKGQVRSSRVDVVVLSEPALDTRQEP
jgi:outer membrane protein OmpA-like peptidoglycan-associated protein